MLSMCRKNDIKMAIPTIKGKIKVAKLEIVLYRICRIIKCLIFPLRNMIFFGFVILRHEVEHTHTSIL
jgi:hypothetical protein